MADISYKDYLSQMAPELKSQLRGVARQHNRINKHLLVVLYQQQQHEAQMRRLQILLLLVFLMMTQ